MEEIKEAWKGLAQGSSTRQTFEKDQMNIGDIQKLSGCSPGLVALFKQEGLDQMTSRSPFMPIY